MYRAKESFSGLIIMKKNEVKEIKDKKLVADLLKAGLIEEHKTSTPKELQKENENLKKELADAYATIEELNKKIAELETSDDEGTPDGEPSNDEGNSDEETSNKEEK